MYTGAPFPVCSWMSSAASSEQYVRGLVVVGGQSSEDVRVRSTPLDNSMFYVGNLVLDDHEDYNSDEDRDNDLEQSADVASSSSLMVESSPYLDAVIHHHDVELSYSVVRPRHQS